ncbi:MAG: AAC(3) family N-acetyltransferase [Thermoproteota archaeon]
MQKFESTKEEIVRDLVKMGVEKGDVILVHSSLSSIGYVRGGAETMIYALLESIGEEGTVVVPTITGQIFDSPEYPPSFSKDKPCWTGIVSETFRKRKEAYRSRHPTHSVAAIGKDARKIIEGHEDAKTPCGKGTPYLKIPEFNGKILFIGATLETNTTFHSVEELAKLYYHIQPEPSICKIDMDGKQVEKKYFLHAYGTPRAFDEKERELVEHSIARTGYVGRARSILVDAKKMIEFTLGKTDEDRLYFVKKDYIDLWSISSSIRLLQESQFKSVKISLYLPESATLKFLNNQIVVSGVRMNLFAFSFINGTLETSSKIIRELELAGGYNYWLKFEKGEKGIQIEVLDFKESDSLVSF